MKDRAERLQRIIDGHDRLIMKVLEDRFTMPEHAELDHVRRLIRQAIELAWEAMPFTVDELTMLNNGLAIMEDDYQDFDGADLRQRIVAEMDGRVDPEETA